MPIINKTSKTSPIAALKPYILKPLNSSIKKDYYNTFVKKQYPNTLTNLQNHEKKPNLAALATLAMCFYACNSTDDLQGPTADRL
jgi:hypothetical protein